MKRGMWKVIAATAVAGLSALGLQASASAAGGATTSAPPPRAAAALPFPAHTETVFHPISPVRILDTRSSLGGHPGKISSGNPFNLQVTGGAVPAGASAVAFNVTVVAPTASSFLTIWPTGAAQPIVSNINYVAGQTVANSNTVLLSTSGKMTIRPGTGSTHVLVDIAGYYSKSTAWGPAGYIGWVVANDDTIFAFQHNNDVGIFSRARNGLGDNTFRFFRADISASSGVAHASVEVSVIGPVGSACFTASTSVPDGSESDLEVRVTCVHTTDLTPVNAAFYLQVAG